jgi:hypothetical protein
MMNTIAGKSRFYTRDGGRRDFIASILKGEGGSTYDAIGDAAYCERLVEI